jgi:hypothetical protein
MPGQYFQKTDNTKKSKYLPNTVTEHAHWAVLPIST